MSFESEMEEHERDERKMGIICVILILSLIIFAFLCDLLIVQQTPYISCEKLRESIVLIVPIKDITFHNSIFNLKWDATGDLYYYQARQIYAERCL